MRVLRTCVLACLLAGCFLLAGSAGSFGTTAGAIATKKSVQFDKAVPTARSLSSDVAPLGKPAGYKIVVGGPYNAPSDTQSLGKATCPGTEVPVGGGVLTSPVGSNNPIFFASINSSYPFNDSWFVDVNPSSSSGTDVDFIVYAVCIDKVASYSVVSSNLVDNPAGTSTLATASCPSNRVLIGGGAFSNSTNVAVNINSDFPSGNTWRALMNNESAVNASMGAYAVCEKQPSGYSEPYSIQTVQSQAETPLAVDCPAGTFPLSGGDFTGAVANLNLSSSFPTSYDWVTSMNDGDSNSWPFETVVVCAS